MNTRKPRLWVKMVSPQFHAAVETDAKLQTVRPLPKGKWPIFGDRISLRAWLGKPYRSKQRVLREGVITAVERCIIHADGVELKPGSIGVFWMPETGARAINLYAFAKADGFSDWKEMKAWFLATHKSLPFEGIAITWRPDPR